MTNLPKNQRVLGRTGARELSQDELSLVLAARAEDLPPPSAGTPMASHEI